MKISDEAQQAMIDIVGEILEKSQNGPYNTAAIVLCEAFGVAEAHGWRLMPVQSRAEMFQNFTVSGEAAAARHWNAMAATVEPWS